MTAEKGYRGPSVALHIIRDEAGSGKNACKIRTPAPTPPPSLSKLSKSEHGRSLRGGWSRMNGRHQLDRPARGRPHARPPGEPGHEIDRRRQATAGRAAQSRNCGLERAITALHQPAYRQHHNTRRARAAHFKPAVGPVREVLSQAEGGRVHPARVELPGRANKAGTEPLARVGVNPVYAKFQGGKAHKGASATPAVPNSTAETGPDCSTGGAGRLTPAPA
jgi:hypothetical protein